jgi:hypothetical protein
MILAELLIEGGKMAIKAVRSARMLQDGKHKKLKFVIKLRLLHDYTEQGGNRRRQKRIRAATESAKYKGILTVLDTHSENGPDLIEHNLTTFGCKATIISHKGKLVDIGVVRSSVKTKGSNSNNVALEGLFLDGVIL